VDDNTAYSGREATLVKHEVLRQYLEKLAYKVGTWANTLNYVDGFAGPWKSATQDLSDTSPHIAIKMLRTAQVGLARINKFPTMRCLFVEENQGAFQRLQESVIAYTDIEVRVLQGEFEQRIPDVLRFVVASDKPFTFFFIDPTGWTGFGMKAIAPVLQQPNSEALINFMTKDIKRFIDDPKSVALPRFIDLFGATDYRDSWSGLTGQDREDAIVETYCERVKAVGNYSYVVSAVVLHPTDQRTHFHLIYGTRSDIGLRTFRDVEARTMEQQEKTRATAQQNKRVKQSQQGELFAPEDIGAGDHFTHLRERYLQRSREATKLLLQQRQRVSFDDLELFALSMPMTWSKDISGWLNEWKQNGQVTFEGLESRERTLKPKKGHIVTWIGSK
jgi:three-Cys-motif partner protein